MIKFLIQASQAQIVLLLILVSTIIKIHHGSGNTSSSVDSK